MANNNERFGLELRALQPHEAELLHSTKDLAVDLHAVYESLGQSIEIENAKARLEEAAMWASKHIALNGIES